MIIKTQVEVKCPINRAKEATMWLNAQNAAHSAHQWVKTPQKIDVDLNLDINGKFSIVAVNGVPL